MSENFDPYYEWLGIPADEQPPNHYRLLGITALEASASVIQNAANQRIVYLRTFQLGKHADESQLLLNEVAKAKVCLLVQEKKAAYDDALRRQLAQSAGTSDFAKTDSSPKGLVKASPLPVVAGKDDKPDLRSGAKLRDLIRQPKAVALAGLAVVVVAIGSVCAWFAFVRGSANIDRAENPAPNTSLADSPQPALATPAASSATPAMSGAAYAPTKNSVPKSVSKTSDPEQAKSNSEVKQPANAVSARQSNLSPPPVAAIAPTEHDNAATKKAAPSGAATETHESKHEVEAEKTIPKRPPPSAEEQCDT